MFAANPKRNDSAFLFTLLKSDVCVADDHPCRLSRRRGKEKTVAA